MNKEPLLDTFGRRHASVRISVTDRCNIRCFYCMPREDVVFQPRSELLTFEEIVRVVRLLASRGVHKVRLTGGEPLLRKDLPELVRQLALVEGIDDLALTTNGILLPQLARPLKEAGLRRLNISLDALSEEVFQFISRRSGLDRVLAGIAAAREAGFTGIRLNAVAMKGVNEAEIVPLVTYAQRESLAMRFIEYMPLDAEEHWQREAVLSGEEIRARIEAELGPLTPATRFDASQPARDFLPPGSTIPVGLIQPVSQPFCGDCDRLRLTADGKLRNCLFSTTEWDLREPLRSGASEEQLERLVRECVAAKKPGHGIDSPEFLRPERAMFQIGG